jgi:hypothetical protein
MRRMIFLAGLALAVGLLVTGSALPAVGGSDLPLDGTFSGTTTHNLATGHLDGLSTGELTHLGQRRSSKASRSLPPEPPAAAGQAPGR